MSPANYGVSASPTALRVPFSVRGQDNDQPETRHEFGGCKAGVTRSLVRSASFSASVETAEGWPDLSLRQGTVQLATLLVLLALPVAGHPSGLYTESIVATSISSRAPPAWITTDGVRSRLRSPLVSAATRAKKPRVCAYISETMVAMTFIKSLNRTQKCRNNPHLVPGDWIRPVSSEPRGLTSGHRLASSHQDIV